jgi:hypothetical protein
LRRVRKEIIMNREEKIKLLEECKYYKLTDMECDTIVYLMNEKYNSEYEMLYDIATVYNIKFGTIRNRFSRIAKKLKCQNNKTDIVDTYKKERDKYYEIQGIEC